MFAGELSYSLTKYSQPKMLARKINDWVITGNSRKSHEVESGKKGTYILKWLGNSTDLSTLKGLCLVTLFSDPDLCLSFRVLHKWILNLVTIFLFVLPSFCIQWEYRYFRNGLAIKSKGKTVFSGIWFGSSAVLVAYFAWLVWSESSKMVHFLSSWRRSCNHPPSRLWLRFSTLDTTVRDLPLAVCFTKSVLYGSRLPSYSWK